MVYIVLMALKVFVNGSFPPPAIFICKTRPSCFDCIKRYMERIWRYDLVLGERLVTSQIKSLNLQPNGRLCKLSSHFTLIFTWLIPYISGTERESCMLSLAIIWHFKPCSEMLRKSLHKGHVFKGLYFPLARPEINQFRQKLIPTNLF